MFYPSSLVLCIIDHIKMLVLREVIKTFVAAAGVDLKTTTNSVQTVEKKFHDSCII